MPSLPNVSKLLDRIDHDAIRSGAMWCLIAIVPAALIIAAIDDDGDSTRSNWELLLVGVIVAGYLVGGARAARKGPSTPFLNGALACVAAFVIVQIVAAIVNLLQGDGFSPLSFVFNLLLAATIGTCGAWFGLRRASREAATG